MQIITLIALIVLFGGIVAADPTLSEYVYDVAKDGSVSVTVHPVGATSLRIPVTAEQVTLNGAEIAVTKQWELFAADIALPAAADTTVTYTWADGALPWPLKQEKWCADSFLVVGPAKVTFILPPGAKLSEVRSRDLPSTKSEADGRVTVSYELPAAARPYGNTGIVYEYPWVNAYAVAGKPSTPVYYPKVMSNYPEYMKRVDLFARSTAEFYDHYKKDLGYAPPVVKQFLISWVAAFGGAYTYDGNTWFPYQRIAGFECPPTTDGNRLMGAYHEMGHGFQPGGYPGFIGGHVWTRWLTLDYDWNIFPTLKEANERIAKGGAAEDALNQMYATFKDAHAKGTVPGAWLDWTGEYPGLPPNLQFETQAAIMLKISQDLGWTIWAKFRRNFLDTGITYGDVPAPLTAALVATHLSKAAGRDLTPYLTDLTGCDFKVDLPEQGDNLLANGGMEEDGAWTFLAWKPSGTFTWDTDVKHSGKRSLRIDCPEGNDAHMTQALKVAPSTPYLFTAWIRTKGVAPDTMGATIGKLGSWDASQSVVGDNKWKRLMVPLRSDDKGDLTLALRIGFYGDPASGTAWFDDVELIPLRSNRAWKMLTAP